MGIELTYRRLSPEALGRCLADPKAQEKYFFSSVFVEGGGAHSPLVSELGGEIFSLGKEWHALHFLLTGERDLEGPPGASPPLRGVVRGGVYTRFDATYGRIRELKPAEVAAAAGALRGVSAQTLQLRFSPDRFNEFGIYPAGRHAGWTADGLEVLLELYPVLVNFFVRAAAAGDFVLLSFD